MSTDQSIQDIWDSHKKPDLKTIKRMNPGRNDFCPCASGKKFKKCCYLEIWRKGI